MNKIVKNSLCLVASTRHATTTTTTKFSSNMWHMVNHGYVNNNSIITSAKSHNLLINQCQRQLHTSANPTKNLKIDVPSPAEKPENGETPIDNEKLDEAPLKNIQLNLSVDPDGKISLNTQKGLKVCDIDEKLHLMLKDEYLKKPTTMEKWAKYIPEALFAFFCYLFFH